MSKTTVIPLPCAGHVNTVSDDRAEFYPCPDIDGIQREHCCSCEALRLGLVRMVGDGCQRVSPDSFFQKIKINQVNLISPVTGS